MMTRTPHGTRSRRILARITSVAAMATVMGGVPSAYAVSASSTTPDRPTTAAAPALSITCPERRSTRRDLEIRNYLPVGISLEASLVDCRDWSNTGNPTNVNGDKARPTSTLAWPVEQARSRATASWALTLDSRKGALGSVALQLRDNGGRLPVQLVITDGAFARVGTVPCWTKRIGATNLPKTSPVPAPIPLRLQLQVYSDGRHVVARTCSVMG